VTLNQPELHNAFNELVIEELIRAFRSITTEAKNNNNKVISPLNSEPKTPTLRSVVLTGNGKSFSAGADLRWMKKMVKYTEQQNREDSQKLFEMISEIRNCALPVVGRINGSALGGGAGLVAACDISLAVSSALFGFTEVKLGLIPAVISPFVIQKIGKQNALRYFLTGEKFGTEDALKMGLIHEYFPTLEQLDMKISELIDGFATNAPTAVMKCKQLIHKVSEMTMEEAGPFVTDQIARIRVSPEGQEGLSSFLEKRTPSWATRRTTKD